MGSGEGVTRQAKLRFTVIVPARYASSRLPGKPLADLGGAPMVVRVAQRARQSGAERVVVATDDPRIEEAVRAHGVDAMMTRADHPSGTDRVAEAAMRLALRDDDIVVNVQGDEPLLEPALMRRVAALLDAHADAAIATACHAIVDADEAFNPNVVKVALDARNFALYFSRATIPWARDAFAADRRALPAGLPLYRHYGLYAYRARFLAAFPALAPAPIERVEALAQRRGRWHGPRIGVGVAPGAPAPGGGPEQDLARVRDLLG